MSSPTPARVVGTLIAVVMKAKNLPNKRSIGKQDPYCALQIGKEIRRTKPVKRGGQHPVWDEELRFPLTEDTEDLLARTSGRGGDGNPPPVPSKGDDLHVFNKKRKMRLAIYADDPREPELIGEIMVDLEPVLTKGETDEWYTINFKDKYCGEVYLEMTFWSNAKPPAKKQNSSSTVDSMYGGPGTFSSAAELTPERTGRPSHPGSAQRRHSKSPLPRYRGADEIMPDLDRNDALPESLRPSASLAKLDLYQAPYESRSSLAPASARPLSAYDEFGAGPNSRRRDSFPPLADGNRQYSSVPAGRQSRVASGSITTDMSRLSLSNSYGPSSSRPSPTAVKPAYYEPSYPAYQPTATSSSYLSQPTGSTMYPARTSPSPAPAAPPVSSGFMSPEQADRQYGGMYGSSISPGSTGVNNGYLSQPGSTLHGHRTSDPGPGLYPPQPTGPTMPVATTGYGPPPNQMQQSPSRESSFTGQQPQQYQPQNPYQPPPNQMAPQLTQQPTYTPSSSYSSLTSSSSQSYNYNNAPNQQTYQPQPPYSNQLPPQPTATPMPNALPYQPTATPQPPFQQQPTPPNQNQTYNQVQYNNTSYGSAPAVPWLAPQSQAPYEPSMTAPPPSHSAPPAPQQQMQQNNGMAYAPGPVSAVATSGHAPRMSSSGSIGGGIGPIGLGGRPLPDPQQIGQGHTQSQPILSGPQPNQYGYSNAPTPAPIQQQQQYPQQQPQPPVSSVQIQNTQSQFQYQSHTPPTAAYSAPGLPTPPTHTPNHPTPPPPQPQPQPQASYQPQPAQLPPPPPPGQPISAYEQFQQMQREREQQQQQQQLQQQQQQQQQSGLPPPPDAGSAALGRARSLPPVLPPAPMAQPQYSNPSAPQGGTFNAPPPPPAPASQYQPQNRYSTSYSSVPPPPSIPAQGSMNSIVPPPPPPPLSRTPPHPSSTPNYGNGSQYAPQQQQQQGYQSPSYQPQPANQSQFVQPPPHTHIPFSPPPPPPPLMNSYQGQQSWS